MYGFNFYVKLIFLKEGFIIQRHLCLTKSAEFNLYVRKKSILNDQYIYIFICWYKLKEPYWLMEIHHYSSSQVQSKAVKQKGNKPRVGVSHLVSEGAVALTT